MRIVDRCYDERPAALPEEILTESSSTLQAATGPPVPTITVRRRSGAREVPMRPRSLLFALPLSTALLVSSAEPSRRDFESDAVGSAPAGFEFARTGGGAEGQWVVRIEKGASTNHVLVQESADPTDYRFPLAVLKEGTYKDVTLSVRARPLAGRVDQGFGLVWRYRDKDNYYVTRCNADEDNCTIYHTVAGRRRPFLSRNVKVAKSTWHTLKLEATGDRFVVSYDGTVVLDAKDSTFNDPGRVGLWSKADSVIEFDDFTVARR
jgi:hypothetical protein